MDSGEKWRKVFMQHHYADWRNFDWVANVVPIFFLQLLDLLFWLQKRKHFNSKFVHFSKRYCEGMMFRCEYVAFEIYDFSGKNKWNKLGFIIIPEYYHQLYSSHGIILHQMMNYASNMFSVQKFHVKTWSWSTKAVVIKSNMFTRKSRIWN